MEIVLQKIRGQLGGVVPLIETRLMDLWMFGVDKISDPLLKNLVVALLEETIPWQFFVAPAASSGKHHPVWQNMHGGLVRHTMEMCVLAPQIASIYPELTDKDQKPTKEAMDIILAAIILHDSLKNGLPWGKWTIKNHHEVAANQWDEAAEKARLDDHTRDSVFEAIFWHAGRWTQYWDTDQMTPFAWVVHITDMVTSAKELETIYLPEEDI